MKKIGKLLLLFLWLVPLCVIARDAIKPTLRVKDRYGKPLLQAGVGTPFMASITLEGNKGSVQAITITASDELTVQEQGSTNRITSIGGVTTHQTIVHFAVHADQAGTFILGPAQVTVDDTVYTTNIVRISVQDTPASQVLLQEPRLEMRVGKKQLVVGQTVPFSLRFYHLDKAQLSSVAPPEISGFTLGKLEGPERGTAEINGVEYEYVEWHTYLTAKKAGSFVIKPARAVYAMQARARSSLFKLLSDNFAFGMQEYEANSNVIKLTVDPLPPLQGDVHGVGSFSHVTASVNQTHAKQGEGIVYSLEVTGDPGVIEMEHPHIKLPESVTTYDSKSSVHSIANRKNQFVKRFEYIVQARETGRVTIPSQAITYYDPELQRYAQRVTKSIELTIGQADQAPVTTDLPEDTNQFNNREPLQDTKLPLYTGGTWYPAPDAGMSPFIFWLLLLLLLAALFVQWARFFWYRYCTRNYIALRQRAAFKNAHKHLKQAKNTQDVQRVYSAFIELFAARRGVLPTQISEHVVTRWLRNAQMPSQTLQQWQRFFRSLQAQVFYTKEQHPSSQLFDQAEQWLMVLEKLL